MSFRLSDVDGYSTWCPAFRFAPFRSVVSLVPKILIALFFILYSSITFAQRPVDAGQISRQIEERQQQALPKPDTEPVDPCAGGTRCAKAPKDPSLQEATVTVSSFEFRGNTLLSSERLALVVMNYLNRPLTLDELKGAAVDVGKTYRDSGWIVQTFIPLQESANGVIAIEIVEAVFGKVTVEGEASSHVKLDRIKAVADAAQPKGEHLNVAKLDRALLMLDDLPGVYVQGSLARGEGQYETDLILTATDEPWYSGQVDIDNSDPRATGGERVTATVRANSPLRIGDQVISHFMVSQGNRYGGLYYALPVGIDGWRLTANATALNYELVSPEFETLQSHGSSRSYSVGAKYPLLRARLKNLYVAMNFQQKDLENYQGNAITSRYQIQNHSLSFTGNLVDKLAGGGLNTGSVTLTNGQLDLDKTDTYGQFNHLRYSISRNQNVVSGLSARASLSGQLANKNLDSGEKFYLGGVNGVRAYPENEGGGADGQVLNLELVWSPVTSTKITGFYDRGHVHVNHFNMAPYPNDYTLEGIGLAVGWQGGAGLNLSTTIARRLGSNPHPSADGIHDQDGSLHLNRLWLQASMPF